MNSVLQFTGPDQAVELFGVKLVGLNAVNAKKLVFTLLFLAIVGMFAWLVGKLAALIIRKKSQRAAFWTRQAIHVFSVALMLIGFASIWFSNPARLATAFGLVTAGLAFALQRVITALAAYLVILRGKTFSIGDRIVMGGVRGDVMDLGFIQTTVMEMGEPPGGESGDPSTWVKARQYSGRIVTITNDKIFETPVYNYTREFPFIWEEMMIPISYTADLGSAEKILIEAAREETVPIAEIGEQALRELERRYFVKRTGLEPRVYIELTDNWVQLSLRFIARTHGVRDMKDRMSRTILREFGAAKIGVASGTYEVVGMPPMTVRLENPPAVGAS